MKINHRVSLSPGRDKETLKELMQLGVPMQESAGIRSVLLYFFDISEDDPVWPKISDLLRGNNIPYISWMEFTDDEISSSEWVWVTSGNVLGYPMPDMDGGWRKLSFDCRAKCTECGIGMVQKAPIHLVGEPDLREDDFMTIEWTYDLFARVDVIEDMMRNCIQGFENLPATEHSSGASLKTIRQIRVKNVLPACLITDELIRIDAKCGHMKYQGPKRSILRFSRDGFSHELDFVKTYEWFGSGHAATQLILASRRFVRLYLDHKWKGLTFQPIILV
jgi:hypothetical protein